MSTSQPIACDISQIAPAERDRHIAEGKAMFAKRVQTQQLVDGYVFAFAADAGILEGIARFVELERRCCPFFDFNISVVPGGGPISLKIAGGEGVKSFIEQALLQALID